MTENELNLLHRYLDGAITPEELESLNELLRSSAEARSTLRSLATIDAKWQEIAAEATFETANEPHGAGRDSSHRLRSKNRRLAPRRSPKSVPRSRFGLPVQLRSRLRCSLVHWSGFLFRIKRRPKPAAA